MARSRSIKPGFYKNDMLAECSLEARLLFPGLWMLADREGRLENRPKKIKGEIFPFDDITVIKQLEELKKWGFIETYSYNSIEYIQISNFLKHQTPHSTEKDSDIPDSYGYLTKYKRDRNNRIIPDSKEIIKLNQCDKTEQLNNSYESVNKHIDNSLTPDSCLLNPDYPTPDSCLLNPEKSANADLPAKKTKKSQTEILLSEFEITGQLADDFIEHRKHCGKSGKGAPITKTVMDAYQREARNAGIAITDAVRISIERNWQGFRSSWDWQDKDSPPQGSNKKPNQAKQPMQFPDYSELWEDSGAIDSTATVIN